MVCFQIYRHRWIRALPKFVCVLIIVGSAFVIFKWEGRFDRFLIAGVPSFFFLLCGLQMEEGLRNMHSRFLAVLVHIGDASYATYLSHMFVIGIIERLLFRLVGVDNKNMATAAFEIACCLGVGSIIYKFIDMPMVKISRNFMKKRHFAGT